MFSYKNSKELTLLQILLVLHPQVLSPARAAKQRRAVIFIFSMVEFTVSSGRTKNFRKNTFDNIIYIEGGLPVHFTTNYVKIHSS